MTQSPTTWLNQTTTQWVPSPSQFDGARGHRETIRSKLDASLGIFGLSEIGSLSHGTGIHHYSDADYLVSLKGTQPQTPITALNNVKAALQARYPYTSITIRQPAVVCNFSDGVVEVVPGYSSAGGYQIPDPTGGWMLTHPADHNAYVSDANQKFGGAAKKLARQLKIWKYRRSVPVSSCYLEMRAAKYIKGESAYLPLVDLAGVLKSIQDAQFAAMNDPTGMGSRFNATSSPSKHADALSKLDRAVTRAVKARDLEGSGHHEAAIDQLKLLFNL